MKRRKMLNKLLFFILALVVFMTSCAQEETDLTPCRVNGKMGYCNENDDVIISAKYSITRDFQDGIAFFGIGTYEREVNSPTKWNGKYGLINDKGLEIIPATYSYAFPFYQGVAAVLQDHQWIFIDKQGKRINTNSYVNIKTCTSKGNSRYYHRSISPSGRCMFIARNDDKKYGVIDYRGRAVIPLKYDWIRSSPAGLYIVDKNDLQGYVDTSNVQLTPLQYYRADPFQQCADPFQQCGIARVQLTKTGTWGFINRQGEKITECIYDVIGYFRDGLAGVTKNKKAGFINEVGDVVIPLIYDYALLHPSIGLIIVKGTDAEGNYGMGLITVDGKEISPFIYEAIRVDGDTEIFAVRKNGKWGYINKTGVVIIPIQYESALTFHKGKAWVTYHGTSFYIDKNGMQVK